jgi:hypothetical protein
VASPPLRFTLSVVISGRQFATKSGVYRQKSFVETWASDKGAWPVMGTFGIMVTFVAGFGLWYMATSPDVRLIGNRRNQFLRGELAAFSHRDKN